MNNFPDTDPSVGAYVVLKSAKDWPRWKAQVQAVARRDENIQYLPDVINAENPDPATLVLPPQRPATDAQNEWTKWTSLSSEYREKRQQIKDLMSFMQRTVDQNILYFVDDETTTTPGTLLLALKAFVSPNDTLREDQLTKEVSDHRQRLNSMPMQDWVNIWITFDKDSKDFKHISRRLPKDFLDSVGTAYPDFRTAYIRDVVEGNIKLQNLIAAFNGRHLYAQPMHINTTMNGRSDQRNLSTSSQKNKEEDRNPKEDKEKCLLFDEELRNSKLEAERPLYEELVRAQESKNRPKRERARKELMDYLFGEDSDPESSRAYRSYNSKDGPPRLSYRKRLYYRRHPQLGYDDDGLLGC
jgi:hypothetical protein